MNGKHLKLIAVISMTIDHIGAVLIGQGLYKTHLISLLKPDTIQLIEHLYNGLRMIGRLAFPIFCFLLVEGFVHTKNRIRYALRLALFAVIAEIPFDLGLYGSWFYPKKQSVMLTLLIAYFTLWGMEVLSQTLCRYVWLSASVRLLTAAAGMLLAWLCRTDYSYKGVLAICVIYLFSANHLVRCAAGACTFIWEWPAMFAFVPICFYNGERGRQNKYFFYIYYPAHLLVLWAVSFWIIPMTAGG